MYYLTPQTFLKVSFKTVCAMILLIESKFCIQRYLETHSKVIQSFNYAKNLTFIGFTVCPSFQNAYKSQVLELHGISKNDYKNGNFSNIGYNTATYNWSEIIKQIWINTADPKIPSYKLDLNNSLDTKYSIAFGRCFTIEIPKKHLDRGITTISIYSKIDTFIYLHFPGQFQNHVDKTKVQTTVGKKYYLDLKYNLNEDLTGKTCSKNMDFHYDSCVYRTVHQKWAQLVNCSVPFLPNYSKVSICIIFSIVLSFLSHTIGFSVSQTLRIC